MKWSLNLHNLAVPSGQIVGYIGHPDTPPTKWLAAIGNETLARAAVSNVANRALAITAVLFALELEQDIFR